MTVPPELPDFATSMGILGEGKTLGQVPATGGEAPRTIHEMTGWDIDARHRNTGVMRQLETFNRMEQNLDVETPRREGLLDWVQEMNGVGVVLDYHPDAPPNDASRIGGFFFRRREAGDQYFFRRHG